MTAYTITGYIVIKIESWTPLNISLLSRWLYILRIVFVISAPFIATLIGLSFIFRQAEVFIRAIFQPEKHEKLARLIRRRFLMEPYYQFIVILVPSLNKNHWARWLGGPATLIIHDGVAVYLEDRNQIPRVVGPGISFLKEFERIKEVVDLRPQTKTGIVIPWTKDGIRIKFTIRAECQIDASPEAIAQSSNFRFPFDPLAVKTAVQRMTVRVSSNGELYEASWLDGAWGTITGVINAYIAGHTLDELFLAWEADRTASLEQTENGTYAKIEQVLSHKLREQLGQAKRNLAQNGVKALSVQIINVEVPAEVQELREKYWESAKERIAALRNSRAEADRIRIRSLAHAEAQRTMLNAITQRLERVDPNNLTEPLIISLSGILDQDLDDPIVRLLIANESFSLLDKIRKWLNEGF
jgi:hypothetical protein